MYGQLRNSAGAVGASATGVLPFTGINVLWMLIAGLVLIIAGVTALSLVPRREK